LFEEGRSIACLGRAIAKCLLHVYWTGLHDPADPGQGHLLQRGKVSADLGLDAVPNPPFTNEEMQQIMFAAKMQAIKCLRARRSK
jgi:hypothetical protein